jgi:hypothetical protein
MASGSLSCLRRSYSHNSFGPDKTGTAFLIGVLGVLIWFSGWVLASLISWLIRQVRPRRWNSTDG